MDNHRRNVRLVQEAVAQKCAHIQPDPFLVEHVLDAAEEPRATRERKGVSPRLAFALVMVTLIVTAVSLTLRQEIMPLIVAASQPGGGEPGFTSVRVVHPLELATSEQRVFHLPPKESEFQSWDGPWFSEGYTMLVSGDTVHFLKYRYGGTGGVHEDPYAVPLDLISATCYVLDEQGEAVPCPDGCGEVFAHIEEYHIGSPVFGLATTPQNETYLVDAAGQVLRWTPGGAEPWETVVQLDFSGVRTLRSDFDDTCYAADEDGLYIAFIAYQQACELYAFDWETGARRLITKWGYAYDMIPAGPGKLLIEGSPKPATSSNWYLMDTLTGEAEKVVGGTLMVKASDAIWDRLDGCYYASFTDVQRIGLDGEETTVASFASDSKIASHLALSQDGRRFYLLVGEEDDGATFHIVDRLMGDGPTLTINGAVNYLSTQFDMVSSMTSSSPELAGVQFNLRDNQLEAYDVAQLLLNRDDTSDILAVHASSADLRSLFGKGYFAPLEDRPEIADYFERLQPVWQDACSWDGSIAALPLYVYDDYQFMYNTELWEAYDLPVPTSYDELFALLWELDERGLLDEHPLFEINGWETSSFDHLAKKLLRDYMLHEKGTPRFDDPELERLLGALSDLRDTLDRHDALNLTGDPLMIFNGHVTMVTGLRYHEYRYGDADYAPLLLSLDERRGPVLQCHLTLLMVNPYSRNIDLAKAWLANLVANPTESVRCLFLTDMPDGVETERSLRQYAEYEEAEAAFQQAYDEALASGDPEVIEKARDALYLNIEPQRDWVVTPEHAQTLYAALPYAQVVHYNPDIVLLDNGDQAIQEYLSGRRSAHDLLQALQSLAMMIDAEGL